MNSYVADLERLLTGIHHPIHSEMEPLSLSIGMFVMVSRGENRDEIELRINANSPECFDALMGVVIHACGNTLAGVDSRSSPLTEDEEGSLVAIFSVFPGVRYSLSTSDCITQLV